MTGGLPPITFGIAPSPLGEVLVARTERGVCAVLLGDDRDALETDLGRRFARAPIREDAAGLADELAAVVAFIDSPRDVISLPLDIHGTDFQRRVWSALREVPAGRTVSYRQLAERIGAPTASRAVAGACAANPLAVIIPCHRVVRAGGDISGYRWGVERKRELLRREGRSAG